MKKIIPLICVAGTLAIAGVFLWHGAQQESPIVDEPPHLTAGYSYLHFLDYRLNPEHPPFAKVIAAAFTDGSDDGQPVHFPTDNPGWQQDVNGQWGLSHVFLFDSGNDGQSLVTHARRGPILVTLAFILLFSLWLWRTYGRWWGVVGAILLGFSPFFLGHGDLVTTDVAAAFGAFLSSVAFGWFLKQPSSLRRGLAAGLAFGFAELGKFSLVLLLPAFVIVAVLYLRSQGREWRQAVWVGMKRSLLIALVGFALVIYPTYALFTVRYPAVRQVRDTAFILGSFASGPTPTGHFCKPVRCIADTVIWGAGVPGVRPAAEYALGVLMVLQRTVGGNTNYFLGSVSASGSWSYFPVVYVLKETLSGLALLLIAVIGAIILYIRWHRGRSHTFLHGARAWLLDHPVETVMAAFVIIYWLFSLRSSLNIGVRHLFPIIPLMYVLALFVWRKWYEQASRLGRSVLAAGLIILAAGQVATVFAATPYFLAYFNPLVGGTTNGYRYVTDSNYDWGQDLVRLRAWLDAHPEAGTIAVDYFGGGDVAAQLGPHAVRWQSSDGDPRAKDIHWLAVSVSVLQDAIQPAVPGQDRLPADEYQWLTAVRPKPPGMGSVPPPDTWVGTSYLIYRLP